MYLSSLNWRRHPKAIFRDDAAASRYETLHAVVDALRISAISRDEEDIRAVQERWTDEFARGSSVIS